MTFGINSKLNTQVLTFIFHFTDAGTNKGVLQAFTCGCCYWFAEILQSRFVVSRPIIMYAASSNHFGTLIMDKVYDITGDVTGEYEWESWSDFKDDAERLRIIRDCVNF
jgi:hypothetical protein